jgi:hypothetical protein
MAFTYSGDPSSSDLDQVRFLVQDTDPGTPLLSDEEITFLIGKWFPLYDSLTYVAAVCAAAISRRFVSLVNVSADGVSVDVEALAQRFRDLAVELRAEYRREQEVGADIDIENVMVGTTPDPSIRPLRFAVGLHDNWQAGQQDYGGWTYDPFADAEASWR